MTQQRCTSCFGPMPIPHVDKYHRFTPLCGECYSNPRRARDTASVKDDPESWWNKDGGVGGHQ